MKQTFMRMCAAALVATLTCTSLPVLAKGSSSGSSRGFSGGGGFGRPAGGGGGGGFFKSPTSSPSPARVAPTAPAPAKQATVVTPPPPAKPVPTTPAPANNPPTAQKSLFAKKDAPVGMDRKAFEAQQHADSKAAFEAAKARKAMANQGVVTEQPRVVATSAQPSGAKVYDLSAVRSKRVEELANKMARNQYRQRDVRAQEVYGSYYRSAAPARTYYSGGYRDSYSNPAFWWWLDQQDQAERERFIYNHRAEIDPRRLEDMNSAYPELSAKLNQLDGSGIKPDTNYIPTNLKGNEDLMYGDDIAQQAKVKAADPGSISWFWILLTFIVAGASVWYVLFGTKWKVRQRHV